MYLTLSFGIPSYACSASVRIDETATFDGGNITLLHSLYNEKSGDYMGEQIVLMLNDSQLEALSTALQQFSQERHTLNVAAAKLALEQCTPPEDAAIGAYNATSDRLYAERLAALDEREAGNNDIVPMETREITDASEAAYQAAESAEKNKIDAIMASRGRASISMSLTATKS